MAEVVDFIKYHDMKLELRILDSTIQALNTFNILIKRIGNLYKDGSITLDQYYNGIESLMSNIKNTVKEI